MPPEGFETVTLPSSLVERLEELDGDSPTATIRMLLAEHKRDSDSDTVQLDGGTVNDIANETANQVTRELESMLR